MLRKIRPNEKSERGQALIMVAGMLVALIGFAGLAVDAGRAYLVSAQLAKAVDAAVLAGVRASGTKAEKASIVERVLQANFPERYMGIDGRPEIVDLDIDPDAVEAETGYAARKIRLTAKTRPPTTFLKALGLSEVPIQKSATVLRRVLDIVIVADHSGSIGEAPFEIFRRDIKDFLDLFDSDEDRVGLLGFGGNMTWLEPRMSDRPGFDREALKRAIDGLPVGGWTATAPALYEAYQELLRVGHPGGRGARWKAVLLFTDGTPNTMRVRLDPSVFTAEPDRDGRTGGCVDDRGRRFCNLGPCYPADRPREMIEDGTMISAGEVDNPDPGARQIIFGLYRVWGRGADENSMLFKEWGYSLEDPGHDSSPWADDPLPRSCADPRHLVGYGGTEPDLRRRVPARPRRELPFADRNGRYALVDFNGIALTPQNRPADGGPISRRSVQWDLPQGPARWTELRRQLNGMARNVLENTAHTLRAPTSQIPNGITIYAIGLNGEAGQMLAWNTDWQEYGQDICQRVANVPEAGEFFDPSQPRGLFVLADEAQDLARAFEIVAHAILRLTQ